MPEATTVENTETTTEETTTEATAEETGASVDAEVSAEASAEAETQENTDTVDLSGPSLDQRLDALEAKCAELTEALENVTSAKLELSAEDKRNVEMAIRYGAPEPLLAAICKS